jgi:hypothetical protein
MKPAGYEPYECKVAGFTIEQMKAAGYAPWACREAGFSFEEARSAGFRPDDADDAARAYWISYLWRYWNG